MDKIVVNSQEDMERICDWVIAYLNGTYHDALDAPVKFIPPFEHGELFFPDEPTTARFDYIGQGDVRFDVITGKSNMHMGSFVFNYSTQTVTDRKFDPKYVDVPKAIRIDDEKHYCLTLATRWMSVMLLALHYRPEVERTKQVVAEKKSAKKRRSKSKKPAKTIYTREYVLTGDMVEALPKPPRHHAKPSHEFGVKGHFRRYKSGKVAWIKPHIRCKGKGADPGSTYVARIEPEKEAEA